MAVEKRLEFAAFDPRLKRLDTESRFRDEAFDYKSRRDDHDDDDDGGDDFDPSSGGKGRKYTLAVHRA